MNSDTAKAIQQALADKKEGMLGFLSRLVEAESPSRVPTAQDGVLDLLQKRWQRLAWSTTRIRGQLTGGHLFARPLSRQRCQPLQLMVGHCDTVWPLDTLQSMPLRSAGDRLHGPGPKRSREPASTLENTEI